MLAPLEIDRLFTPSQCRDIVALVANSLFSDAGLVRGARDDNIRRARVAWIDETDGGAWVLDRIIDAVIDANRNHFDFDLKAFDEKIQIAWYDAGVEGHFDWHIDMGDGALASKRKLTIVAQLSSASDYDGGVLEINADGRPTPAPHALGAAIFFPSFMPHRVTPVTRGARYSLTVWSHGPAFR